MLRLRIWIVLSLVALAAGPQVRAGDAIANSSSVKRLDRHFQQLTNAGKVVGAQFAIAQVGESPYGKCYGVTAVGSQRLVDRETLFLIGSCSKPFASACVLSLIDDPKIDIELKHPIDRWLPAFGSARIANQSAVRRAPTVDELLSHRAGIYSQKVGMTKEQTLLIRKFDQSLEVAVAGIAQHQLLAWPGKQYAYSGAGYCVAGRVAEIAAGQDFETILQQRLCEPLGLKQTTFFPSRRFASTSIATGVGSRRAPHRLGDRHQFALVGGSLYSTADEVALFGQAIANGWNSQPVAKQLPISQITLQEIGKPRTDKNGYSIGWKVQTKEGRAVRLSHSGALQSYRARLIVDLEGRYAIAGCWTLAGSADEAPIAEVFNDVVTTLD